MKDKTLANARHAWLLQTIKELKLTAPVADIHRKTDLSMGTVSSSINGTRTVTENIIERFCKGFKINFEKAKEQIQRIADASITNPTDKKNDTGHTQTVGNQNDNTVDSFPPTAVPGKYLPMEAFDLGAHGDDDVTEKTKSGNEFVDLGNGFYLMLTPLVHQYAYGSYMKGYQDPEYLEELPKFPIVVGARHKGIYRSFIMRGDSMDNGLKKEAISEGDTVTGRAIDPSLWKSKLHFTKHPDFIIVHKGGIMVKRIIAHDVEKGIITVHSLNPDKTEYPDRELFLGDVIQLLNVIKVTSDR